MPDMPRDAGDRVWWRDGVLYQIYPRSYRDTNRDGVGDLRGVIEKLDHLAWLGVDGIWLNPITASPNDDWGYDVSDYCAVHPALGTMDDVDELIEAAGARGIRVILDIVPNHSSDQHPWFIESRSSRTNPLRDWYVWADAKPDGSPPNNWRNLFDPRNPAWTWDDHTGQYYLNQFLPSQPDLNWWNDDVRAEFLRILRFWFDRGIAGFRIDVCHAIVKDKLLRDNPPATKDDHWYVQLHGLRQVYNADRPEVHDVLRSWRKLVDDYDPHRILVGETYVLDPERLAEFYGDGDELNLGFNFQFIHAAFDAAPLRGAVEHAERLLPSNAWPVWTGGNHDQHRWATRWCGDDPAKIRAAMVMLMGLRGTPFLYYGDEIGMPDTDIPDDRVLDPVGKYHGPRMGRDAERTPMAWDTSPGLGFSDPGVEPWLPYGDPTVANVAAQRDDPASMLHLTRDLIALRRELSDLQGGAYTVIPTAHGALWAWTRGDRVVVAVNLSDEERSVDVGALTVRVGTDRARDGARVSGALTLRPWEAVVATTS
jgi:alpha-glucosidase